MINFEALFKVTYGLYIVSSGNRNLGNGFISNTVFQVTSEPAKFATCCNKKNHTCGLIEKHGYFSVSMLHQKTSTEIFTRFGYKSGKDINKFEGMIVKYDETGVPIVLNDTIAYLECKVVQKIDVGTHLIFIGELINAQITDEINEPITYTYYRQIKKAFAPPNAPTFINKSKLITKTESVKSGIYKCSACGYLYDESKEGIKFSDLPDNWKCPVCGTEKQYFTEV